MKYATRINSFLRTCSCVEDALDKIGRIEGVNYVDMNYPEHFKGLTVGEIKGYLEKNGLHLNAVNLRFRDEYLTGAFDNADPDIRRKAVALCLQAAEVCKALGGSQCIVWLGYDGFDYSFQKDYVEAWENIVLCFREVCERSGCRISVEYKPYEERVFAMIDSWGAAWKLVRDVDCENFGVTLDFCHMLMKKENPAFAAALLLKEKKLFGIHLNDGEGSTDDGLMVGTVHPWKVLELYYYLLSYDYQDVIYFDTFPKRETAEEECRINRRICGACEEKIRRTGLTRIKSLIAKADGVAAADLMADWF